MNLHYVTLSSYFTAPLTTIVLMLSNINSIKEVMLRYKEIMNYQEHVDSGMKIQGNLHKIDVQNIFYSYSEGSSVAVDNITLDIKKGEHIALVGESGSGKSTLIKAILGVIKIEKGKICDNLKKSNKTQITVTHRLASIQNVDTIYVLNKGKLIEKGTHEELMKNKGWYYESIYNCGEI